jgi:hypothetical protein
VLARLRRIAADGHSAATIIASLRRTFGRRAIEVASLEVV